MFSIAMLFRTVLPQKRATVVWNELGIGGVYPCAYLAARKGAGTQRGLVDIKSVIDS